MTQANVANYTSIAAGDSWTVSMCRGQYIDISVDISCKFRVGNTMLITHWSSCQWYHFTQILITEQVTLANSLSLANSSKNNCAKV